MKKLLLLLAVMTCQLATFAQMEDDFETNQYGWTETAGKRGNALVKDGVLHMESKQLPLMSTIYAPFDINKPFTLTCEALAKKIDDDKIFGIVLDYEDEQNYMCFFICEGEARLEVYKENRLIAYRYETIKLKSGKKVGIEFEVEYNLNELIFKVNGIKAMAYRRRIQKDEYLLGTSGIGFFARNGQIIDFDNLKILQ
ncbi:MAG: hypothetical protein J5900_07435 [Prevotella sp.]|nr:hypothetical protein [Prevotella sp.]